MSAAVTSPAVALTLCQGGAVWGAGQELWLSLAESTPSSSTASVVATDVAGEDGEGERVPGTPPGTFPELLDQKASGDTADAAVPVDLGDARRGSSRYDFYVLWRATISSSPTDAMLSGDTQGRSTEPTKEDMSDVRGDGVDGGGVGKGESERGLGPSGGHVVGELRPLDEFSAARHEALDQVPTHDTLPAKTNTLLFHVEAFVFAPDCGRVHGNVEGGKRTSRSSGQLSIREPVPGEKQFRKTHSS